MPGHQPQAFAKLLDRARDHSDGCLGDLLERYRNYLYVVARTQIDAHLAVRTSASDLVQETFLKAARAFPAFRGGTEAELLAWLRRILARNIINAYHHHLGSKKRDARREFHLGLSLANATASSRRIDSALAASGTSPSGIAIKHEYAARVADQLARLPHDYRDVIILRNLGGLPFEEVARRMHKTPANVRQLWTRAIRRLQLPEEGHPKTGNRGAADGELPSSWFRNLEKGSER